MHEIFLVVAVVLFVVDALTFWVPVGTTRHPGGRLMAAGLAFFAASFIPQLGG